jgi:CRISPR-associated protein Csx10
MYQLSFQIQTLAPVVISLNYGEINTVNTEKHIPGTTILGMLAWRYLKQTKSPFDERDVIDENFRHFFLSGKITFTNGWLTRKNKYEEEVAFYPAPISFRRSKENEKEIYDILFTDEDFDEQTQAIDNVISMEEYQHTQTILELHHHHARDRVTGSPAEGLLFTYEAISPDQVFRGTLLGDKADLQIILDACEKQWIGWIGRSRNSQYGKVEFSFEGIKPFEMEDLSDEDNKDIVLTMLSHTLIYNEWGFATTCTDDLEKYLCGAKVKRAALKSRLIENFVGIWGFKKPSEIGFHAGSCFLLDVKKADKEKLSELQITGLGERTHEGFGQIKLERSKNKPESFDLNPEDVLLEKPDIPLPDHTRTIVQDIVDNAIYNWIRLLAAEELQKFPDEKSPSGSLIKRLEQFLNSRKNDMEKFRTDINALKGIATDQMERCRSEKMSLMSFFQNKHEADKIETILNQNEMADIQTVCHEVNYQPERNIDELTYIYFETFLSLMRKRIKSKKEK